MAADYLSLISSVAWKSSRAVERRFACGETVDVETSIGCKKKMRRRARFFVGTAESSSEDKRTGGGGETTTFNLSPVDLIKLSEP